jgi:hypothetical protein
MAWRVGKVFRKSSVTLFISVLEPLAPLQGAKDSHCVPVVCAELRPLATVWQPSRLRAVRTQTLNDLKDDLPENVRQALDLRLTKEIGFHAGSIGSNEEIAVTEFPENGIGSQVPACPGER